MEPKSLDILTLFLDNAAALKQHLPWQQPMLRRYAAMLYASAGEGGGY